MKFFNIFKKQVSSPVSDSSSRGSRSPVAAPPDGNFAFRAPKSRSRGVDTDKLIRVCGARRQEEIQKIKDLQTLQQQDSDTPDTSFEEEELRRPSPNMDIFPNRRRPSTDHRDPARKSDVSSDNGDNSSMSMSPASSSPWCRSGLSTPTPGTPQQLSPRAQSPRRDTLVAAHPLPTPPGTPTPSQLRKRAGSAAPQPLPLRRPNVQKIDWSPSPSGSPLRRSPHRQCQSPRFSPHMSPTAPISPRSCPRWEKLAEIGRGSFATVYQGLNKDDGSFFAVKVIHESSSASDIEQEIAVLRRLSKLDHPNIVRYYGSGIDEHGEFCIFLELMNHSLKSVLANLGKGFEEVTIRTYTRQILSGLVYLHENGTIHRDIKCANILVNQYGQVKLADFGVAKQTSEASSFKGTLAYMAPEMINPQTNPTRRSYGTAVDIWSLGCTVLEMADGKPPWSDLPGFGLYFKLSKGQLPPIPEHLSPVAKDFVRACLRFNSEDRPTASRLLQHPFVADPTPRSSPRPSAAGTVGSPQHFFHVEGLRRNGQLNLVAREEHVAALVHRTRLEPQQLRPYEGAQVFIL